MAPTVGRAAPGDTACVTGATAHPGECDPARDWHGRRAVGGRAVAELALPVESPAECVAAGIDAARMTRTPPGAYGREVELRAPGDHWGRPVSGRAVAELAVPVESPAECATAAINATGVTAPRAYRGEDYPARHCHGHRAVGSRAVAEFALPVESPAERLAARVDAAGVTAPGAHGGEGHHARHRHGRRAVGGRAVAELAVVVESPAVRRAAQGNATGVT